jgi:bacterioferritin-associated ferredoxin
MIFNFYIRGGMIVCSCEAVSEKRIVAAIAQGACTREEVTAHCGAGAGCGGCHRTIKLMIRELSGEGSRLSLAEPRDRAAA